MNSFEKLKTKLSELFQLDQADLDFGIYRIMNARCDEIKRFLESDLLPQVRGAFDEYKLSDKVEIQKELDKVVEGVKTAGMDPEQAPKVKELQAKLTDEAVDIAALENEVYDHLYSFFSRYYDDGDFISLRRYKEGVYAIPYEGEEVKLHWANHDQYYIKTTEHFHDYTFKTPSGHHVHFKIVEADTEKDNIKTTNDNDRRFLMHSDKPVTGENGELVIRFEYRPDSEKRKQDVINTDTAKRIIANLNNEKLAVWKDRLAAMWKRAGGKETDKTILDKQLFDYTRRNTFDYFIHKDLDGFLRRELDFYIKNEIMRLDDIEEESLPRVEQYISKIKVIRRIAHKIIDFLAQIENFQKRLWLKKKFVVETNYCMTLDRVPEELYSEIATNNEQREEWVRLFAIDEIEGDLHTTAYEEPLTLEFLNANDKLILDTKYFDDNFKTRLIASIDDFDEHCDGILIHSENFQMLNFLQERYRNQVDCVYIDPPYNTDSSPIAYKNNYKDSSWNTLIENRIKISKELLDSRSLYIIAIDDIEYRYLVNVADNIFGKDNYITTITTLCNPQGRVADKVSKTSEFHLVYANSINCINELYVNKIDGSSLLTVPLKRTGTNSRRTERPLRFYPILYKNGVLEVIKDSEYSDIYNKESKIFNDDYLEELIEKYKMDGYEVILPQMAANGEYLVWQREFKRVKREIGTYIYKNGTVETPAYNQEIPKTCWTSKKFANPEYGSELVKEIIGEKRSGNTAKSVYVVEQMLQLNKPDCILDFFAGSGTTGHAVINLNREGGNRKYILGEIEDYFDTVLKPRIQKVVYSKDWKNGKPISREGVSQMFKYIRLESYEDALANIELQRSKHQQLLIDKAGSFRESYMLKYMLDVEAKESQTLLNIDNFDDPWNYNLLIGAGSVGETKSVNVDLIETFNWLLGLKVKHIDRVSVFQVVEGKNTNGEKVLIIWRKIRDLAETDSQKITIAREQSNRELEAFFTKQQYNTLDSEFDVIYVNGDNNLMNVPLSPDKEGLEPRYKVRLIEEEFKRLMFDVKNI